MCFGLIWMKNTKSQNAPASLLWVHSQATPTAWQTDRGIQLNSSVFYCHFNHIHETTFHRDSSGVTHLTYIKTTLYKNDIRNRLHLVHTLYRLRKVQLTHTSISAWWAVNTEHKHSRELACNVEWSAFNSQKLHQQLAVKWIQITTFLRHSVLTQPTSFTWRQSISSSEG